MPSGLDTGLDALRILIVADDPLVRTGLSALLSERSGYTIAGQMPASAGLSAGLDAYTPDVLIWDLGWDPTIALEQLADLRELKIAVIALLAEENHAAATWAAGARGLLLRNTNADDLVAALAAAARGLTVLDPALATAMLAAQERVTAPPTEELTSREMQVLQALAEGLPNKTIAIKLAISEHTVKFHVNAILTKLTAQSRTEAVVRASRLGLIIL